MADASLAANVRQFVRHSSSAMPLSGFDFCRGLRVVKADPVPVSHEKQTAASSDRLPASNIRYQRSTNLVGPPSGYHHQFRRLSSRSRRLLEPLRLRFSLLRLGKSLAPAFAMTTGWWSGLLRTLFEVPDALAAACFSHISLDLTQMSSICSWSRSISGSSRGFVAKPAAHICQARPWCGDEEPVFSLRPSQHFSTQSGRRISHRE